jgi:hypothetical protein
MAVTLRRKSKLGFWLTAGLLFWVCASSEACVHVPRTYKGTVTEKTKEALLFNDGVNTHLIIRTNLQAASGALPDTMAWVIPLPALPTHYEETDPGIFAELFRIVETANEEREQNSRARGEPQPASTSLSGILVHPMQTVGSYQVQPIEVLDPKNAGSELNSWLLKNGFGAVPPENQRYYLKKGSVFLTLKLHGLSGSFSDVKPLHIVYKSSVLSLPLKFSSHSGVFDVEMYAFTPGPLNTNLLVSENLYADPSAKIINSSTAPLLWQLTGHKIGYLTRFEGRGFNQPYHLVKALPTDPTIDLRKNNAPALASVSRSGLENRFSGNILAASVLVLLGAGAWQWKKRAVPANSFQKP